MMKWLILTGLLFPVAGFAQAAPPNNGAYLGVVGNAPYVYVPLGHCQLSISSTATALSSCSGGIPTGARVAFVTPETAAVRWRDDGTAPTASVGMPLAIGAQLQYSGPLASIQFIAQSGTAALDVAFEK